VPRLPLLPWVAALASPLLGDAYDLAGLAVQWGVPAILVLAGLLMLATTGNGAVIGRRVAGLLTLLAVVSPLSPSTCRTTAAGRSPAREATVIAVASPDARGERSRDRDHEAVGVAQRPRGADR
jgi:hypothetical protein